MILAGDIGGTSARLACFELERGRLRADRVERYASRDYRGLGEIVRAFMGAREGEISVAAFGIPGPVRSGEAVTPNLPWVVTQAELAAALGIDAVWLLNDLEANAYGLPLLGPEDLAAINEGRRDPHGNLAVVSAGTGLGEAAALWVGPGHRPFAGEGGHSSFAPRDALEAELLLHLHRRIGHVSWERVVSGPGLCAIYEFLRDSGRGVEPPSVREEMRSGDPAAVISGAALTGRCALCAAALDLFVSLYAAEAGNFALKVLATGGVYLGGGIAPKIVEKLRAPDFMRSFSGKGRMRDLLETIPVSVVLNEGTALLGAARFAALRAGLPDPGCSPRGAGKAA
ncbi:MAG: glucokinase [Burkholderiales bacterium]